MVRRKVPSLERASSKYMFCLSHRKATRTQASQTDVSYVHVFRLVGEREPPSDRLLRMGPYGGREYAFSSDARDYNQETCTFAPSGERPNATIR